MSKRLLNCTVILLALVSAVLTQIESMGNRVASASTSTPEWSWTTEQWAEQDFKYHQARMTIWEAIMEGQKPIALASRYKANAKTTPYNPPYDALAQFRWAYAAYQAALADPKYRNSAEFSLASHALAYGASPRNYEYARLRFLMESMSWPDPRLKPVGLRLLQRDPHDYQAKYELIEVLDGAGVPADKQIALRYSREMIRQFPKNPRTVSSLAWTYYVLWLQDRDPADADGAVAAYRQYLALVPTDDSSRPKVEQFIKTILSKKTQK